MGIVADQDILASDFINKSERDATKANDDGRVPKLEDDGYLHEEFVKAIQSFKMRETVDGTTTPVPVFVATDNYLQQAKANTTAKKWFSGFMRQAATGKSATFLNGQQYTTATSQSHTLNAGTDRLVLIVINMALVGTTVTATTVTWNGNSCTKLLNNHGNRAGMDVWYYAAGSGGSATGNIVITGATGQASVFADNWEFVDQSSPFQSSQIAAAVSGLTIATALTLTQSTSRVLQYHCDRNGNAVTMDGTLSVRYTEGTSRKSADAEMYGTRAIALSSSTSTTSYTATDRGVGASLALKNSTTNDFNAEVWYERIVGGFSGLTTGSTYYVTDAGGISTTAGTTPIPVGIAISATEIYVQPQKRKASGVATFSANTDVIAFCGFRPSKVTLFAVLDGGSVTNHSFGGWDPVSGNSSVTSGDDNGSGEMITSSTSQAWNTSRLAGAATGSTGVIDQITESGFTLNVSWTSGTTLVRWEAEE